MSAIAAANRRVEWPRLGRRSLLVGPAALSCLAVWAAARGSTYGADFRGGVWQAAQDVLSGRSPYLHPDVATLLAHGHAFIPPPPLALLVTPLARLPFSVAVLLWSAACTAGFVIALHMLGIRDRRQYLVALTSFPFLSSLLWGHPDGLLVLGAALAWRYRSSWPGALAVGALVAAKLLAWPLIIWFLVTGRVRNALRATAVSLGLLGLSWLCIGFRGLDAYPRLLAADARAWQERSYSAVSFFMRAGASQSSARVLAVALACLLALAVVRTARRSDQGWFVAALLLGLLSSPLIEMSYLTLLFVPLALWRPRLDRVWLLPAALWLTPPGLLPQDIQIVLALAVMTVTALPSTPHLRLGHPRGSSRWRTRYEA